MDHQNNENFEAEIFTLTDEDTGKQEQFELVGTCESDGQTYYALVSVENESDEYVILKVTEADGETVLVTIDDDEEFDRIADIFDDELFADIDYDQESEDK